MSSRTVKIPVVQIHFKLETQPFIPIGCTSYPGLFQYLMQVEIKQRFLGRERVIAQWLCLNHG